MSDKKLKIMYPDADILFTRRSIRTYQKGRPISDDLLRFILDASMCAPSARNKQPWHFLVTRDSKKLALLSDLHPYGKMLKEATLAIMVCGDINIEERESAIALDGAAATQNLLLAAHAAGLGAVWLGMYPRKERTEAMRPVFGYPENIIPVSLISLGYPDEEKPRNNNFKPERVHLEKWGKTL